MKIPIDKIRGMETLRHCTHQTTRMKIPIDKILREYAEQAYEEARLRRTGDFQDRDRVFAEILGEFEMNGAAMRNLDLAEPNA